MSDALFGGLALGTGLVLVVAGLLARFELLVYAARRHAEVIELPAGMPYADGPADGSPAAYLVYLDGIGKMRFRDSRDGGRLTDLLVTLAPELRVLGHVLPYSPLAREIARRRGWRWLRQHLAIAVFVYNVLQIFMAADRRYRPLYNRAVGHQIAAQLHGAGYVPYTGIPIVLLGYSGGAQVAIGAVQALQAEFAAPIVVITLGGFHDGSGDLTAARHLHRLTSRRDRIERLGTWIFPLRWPLVRGSAWNRARRADLITVHRLDPAHHVGPLSYISPTAHLPDGRSYLQRTAETIVEIIRGGITGRIAGGEDLACPTRPSDGSRPPSW